MTGQWKIQLSLLCLGCLMAAPVVAKKAKISAEQKAGVVKRCSQLRHQKSRKVRVQKRAIRSRIKASAVKQSPRVRFLNKISKGSAVYHSPKTGTKTPTRAKSRGRSVNRVVPSISVNVSKYHRDVVVIEDDGTLLADKDMDLCAVARAYYTRFADDRDFLFIFGQGRKDRADGFNAYYLSYQSNVEGIGRRLYDYSKECGSNSVLLGLANMNGTKKWAPFVFPLLDLWPTGVIAHEIGHQWISFLDEEVKGIRLSNPDNYYPSHWQPLVDTDASIMYGNNWMKTGRNRFTTTAFPSGYSKLDQYLMGLAPASKVKSFIGIKATSKKIKKHYALPAQSAKGEGVTISIGDIQAVYGKRKPAYGKARTNFRAAAILVLPKGEKLKRGASHIVNYLRKAIAKKMKRVTDGKFKLSMSLNCDQDSHCAADSYCNKGFLGSGKNRCKKKRGHKKTCLRKGHCQSDRCLLGFCAKKHGCTKDSDCKSGQYCTRGLGKKKCKAKKAKGKFCTYSAQCSTGRCSVGRCATAHGCTKDSDCKSTYYCTRGLGKKKCKKRRAKGKFCTHKSQCLSNRCKWGRCK